VTETPTVTGTPTVTETPSPSPTEMSPSSSADTEPDGSNPLGGSGAGAVFFVPGIGLFASGLARRQARRSRH
jgi:hypothetical protein